MNLKAGLFYLLAAFCILTQNIGCQQQTNIEIDKLPAKIEFSSTVLDLGNVGPGTQKTGEFTFTNTGQDILEISKVSYCCGVVTSVDKESYSPGEIGSVQVTYNATSQIGSVNRQFSVYSNDSENPVILLNITANIVRKIAFTPDNLELKLNIENAGCPELILRSLDNTPFSILEFEAPFNSISCDFDPSVKAAEFVLDLKANMNLLKDIPKGTLEITCDHPDNKYLSIPFTVLPYYTANPLILAEFHVEPEKPITRKVWIYNNYKEDFEIESAVSEKNYIKVINQSKIITGTGYQFEIEIIPPPDNGQIKFTDTFNIKIKGGQTISIPCNGYYKSSTEAEMNSIEAS